MISRNIQVLLSPGHFKLTEPSRKLSIDLVAAATANNDTHCAVHSPAAHDKTQYLSNVNGIVPHSSLWAGYPYLFQNVLEQEKEQNFSTPVRTDSDVQVHDRIETDISDLLDDENDPAILGLADRTKCQMEYIPPRSRNRRNRKRGGRNRSRNQSNRDTKYNTKWYGPDGTLLYEE